MWRSSRTKLQRQSYPQLTPNRHTPEIASSLCKAMSQALPEVRAGLELVPRARPEFVPSPRLQSD